MLFCIRSGTPTKDDDGALAWRNVSGVVLFFVALAILVLQIRLFCGVLLDLVRTVWPQRRRRQRQRPKAYRPYSTRNWAAVAVWFLLIVPILASVAMLLPDSFKDFTRANIQASAAAHTKENGEPGAPEGPGSPWGLTTRDWVIQRGVAVMKAWPDVMIFYGFIYVVTLAGLLGRASNAVASVLHWRPSLLRGGSIGMVFISGAFGLLMWLWIWCVVAVAFCLCL